MRQYIGARYVTKIYENSLNPSSADWEANVNYEPLTMVTYNNGSYLSKKEVPANIGDPASNPTYWAQTGFYNGQIAFLQSEIDDINSRVVTPEQFGAVGDGVTDDTAAFNDALNSLTNGGMVYATNKTYRIDDTILITGDYKTLKLRSGCTLLRSSASANITPVVLIQGHHCSLIGEGNSSVVKSENASPYGVVSVGDKDFVTPYLDSNAYNAIKDLHIIGAGRVSTGDPNVGLMSYVSDGAVYFTFYNFIETLTIEEANVGIGLYGNANANIINNIILLQVGNGGNITDDAGILLKAIDASHFPVDNVISNVFHTVSLGATTVRLSGHCSYNSIQGINAEVGSDTTDPNLWAKIFVVDDSDQYQSYNILNGTGVAYGGSTIPNWYYAKNVHISGREIHSKNIDELTTFYLGKKITVPSGTSTHTINASETIISLSRSNMGVSYMFVSDSFGVQKIAGTDSDVSISKSGSTLTITNNKSYDVNGIIIDKQY